jgi:hypothetical protein
MVRDPRDRYEASIARWPNGKLRAGGAVARWNYSVGLAQRNQARYPGRYLAVRYETMVTEPEETLRRLCDFLGEEYTTDMLIMAGAPDFRAKISQGAELAPNETPVTGDYIGLYNQGVPAQDVAFIQAYARRHMRAFGYAMKPVDFTLPERLRFNLLTRPKGLASMWFWLGLERGRQLFPDRLGPTPGSRMLLSQKKGEQQLSPASGAPAD